MKSASAVEDKREHFACIIDEMSFIQKLKGDKTFGEIAGFVLNLENSQQIKVFDAHWETSIKNAKRCRCGSA